MKIRGLSKVFASLRSAFASVVTLALAICLTAVLFMLLPLIQAISQTDTSELDRQVLAVSVEEPPPPPPEPDEPEEEPDEPPPPVESSDDAPPISLDALNSLIDGAGGSFGAGGVNVGDLLNEFGSKIGGDDSFSLDDIDQPPVERVVVNPRPSDEARRKGGTVSLIFTVDERGRVLNPRIGRSTNPDLNRASLEAIRQWVFDPGRRQGEPVVTRNTVKTFRF